MVYGKKTRLLCLLTLGFILTSFDGLNALQIEGRQYILPDISFRMLHFAEKNIRQVFNPLGDHSFTYQQLLPVFTPNTNQYQLLLAEVFGHRFTIMSVTWDFHGCRDDCPQSTLYIFKSQSSMYALKDMKDWNTMLDREHYFPQKDLLNSYCTLAFNLLYQDKSRHSTAWWAEPGDAVQTPSGSNTVVTFPVQKLNWDWAGRDTYTNRMLIKMVTDSQGRILDVLRESL